MSIPQVLMAALFVFPAAETPTPTTEAALPADPFARAATKALRGDFGPLDAWQEAGYRAGLAQGAMATQAVWLTSYYGTEKDGRVDRAGDRCTLRHVAANLAPRYGWIWTRFGLRQVLDCGARRNDDYARYPWRYEEHRHRQPADMWADYWFARPGDSTFGGATRQPVWCAVVRPEGRVAK